MRLSGYVESVVKDRVQAKQDETGGAIKIPARSSYCFIPPRHPCRAYVGAANAPGIVSHLYGN